jgi:hypothetical protein
MTLSAKMRDKFFTCLAASILVGTAPVFTSPALAAPATDLWQALLSQHVKLNGGVDYQGLKKDEKRLDEFLSNYENYQTTGLSEARKKADYINFYNAGMMKNILRYATEKNLDIASPAFLALNIQKIEVPGGNLWNGSYKLAFAGKKVTLDDIEHKLLRGQSPGDLQPFVVKELDPRIHAAVNCAALSCPRVREKAYQESNVEALLEENIREFLSSNQQFSKISVGKMAANSIVFWYYSDFDEFAQNRLKIAGAGTYLSGFISPDAMDRDWKIKHFQANFDDRSRVALKLSSAFDFQYQWQVNDVRNKKDATN